MFWGGCDIMWLERCWDIALVIFMAPRECSTLQGSWPNLPCGRSAPGLSLQFDNDWGDLEQACTFSQYPIHVYIYNIHTYILNIHISYTYMYIIYIWHMYIKYMCVCIYLVYNRVSLYYLGLYLIVFFCVYIYIYTKSFKDQKQL